MKKVTFKPPYRVGRKSGTTVLDSNGLMVVNFGNEEKAQEYVEFLNKKHKREIEMYIGEKLMYKADMIITIHRPKNLSLKDRFIKIMTNLTPRKRKKIN